MSEMRKITAFVPAELPETAQTQTGAGVAQTLRRSLEEMVRRDAYRQLRALRGKVNFDDFDLTELRRARAFGEHGDAVDRG
ncbi:MAG TPA: hypothetical protein VMU93_16095 [Caulobacteraceae bacterium]|nr:hypothetical protein [Caulobacteraceae bacterium]